MDALQRVYENWTFCVGDACNWKSMHEPIARRRRIRKKETLTEKMLWCDMISKIESSECCCRVCATGILKCYNMQNTQNRMQMFC